MRRFTALFVCTLILWTLLALLNDACGGVHIYLFAGALFVTFAALTQPLGPGLVAAAVAGLIFDANTPVAFGTHMILFAATHFLVFRVRERVPRNDTVSRVTVAVLANLVLFSVFSFVQLVRTPSVVALWPRLFVDLICSQLFLVLVAPWFFALQARALVMARIEREQFA